ncbi:MAG TPA: reverse transcriptase family protein [Bryobacteraceae bacterium]|nr:reverse transcriptase family protein [Bryobacteraceae bacterium]
MPNPTLLRVLAGSLLAGEPTVEQIVERCSRTLGRRWRWLRRLAGRFVAAFAGQARPRRRDVIRFLAHDRGFQRACAKYPDQLRIERWVGEPAGMQPMAAAAGWDIPAIESTGALAQWLQLEPGELDWFADLKALGYKRANQRLRHYRYRILPKQSGNVRLIEAPKPRLKQLQRRILTGILDKIPSHPAAQGFLKGRSIRTFVAPHVGQRVVLRMDLQDYFPSIAGARIQACFRTLGYPETVADMLGGICTNATPRDVWKAAGSGIDPSQLRDAWALYARPHLPQGAPTSPALANLCSYRTDCRLAGLAKAAGARYTRYADDLAFSGGEAFERPVERFATHVAAILHEEGFSVHHRKTRIMRQGVRQRLAGLVANRHANVIRTDFDLLKATLTNCARRGADSQNRAAHPNFRAHLEGRVAFVESINPAKGKRLRALLDRIVWS